MYLAVGPRSRLACTPGDKWPRPLAGPSRVDPVVSAASYAVREGATPSPATTSTERVRRWRQRHPQRNRELQQAADARYNSTANGYAHRLAAYRRLKGTA